MNEKKVWKLRCLRAVCLLKASAPQDEETEELALKILRAGMYRNWEVQRAFWTPVIEEIESVYQVNIQDSKEEQQ